eukprot:6112269-Pleurochrysis_carterae.AAC.1
MHSLHRVEAAMLSSQPRDTLHVCTSARGAFTVLIDIEHFEGRPPSTTCNRRCICRCERMSIHRSLRTGCACAQLLCAHTCARASACMLPRLQRRASVHGCKEALASVRSHLRLRSCASVSAHTSALRAFVCRASLRVCHAHARVRTVRTRACLRMDKRSGGRNTCMYTRV